MKFSVVQNWINTVINFGITFSFIYFFVTSKTDSLIIQNHVRCRLYILVIFREGDMRTHLPSSPPQSKRTLFDENIEGREGGRVGGEINI